MASKSFTAPATGAVAGPMDAGAGNTYGTFNLKVNSAVQDCVVALETSPDNTTYTEMARAINISAPFLCNNPIRRPVPGSKRRWEMIFKHWQVSSSI